MLFASDEAAKRIAHDSFNKHHRTHFGAAGPFEPHVRDVLVALHRLGLKVGVIANRERPFYAQDLASASAKAAG